ncbi:MAG: chorismate synthase [Duncaniella sp.]|nr:chorismate synthase [Muribaculum sp.]MCM1255414.1 chorismate synthase [Duncaniella sp.]
MNTIGKIFSFTGFGESHGAAIGGVIDGMPAGVTIDLEMVQHELDRRRPGQSAITTSRKESDTVEVLSGLMDGVTTGTPIGFIIRNENQHSNDYDQLKSAFRPSHADYTYTMKYGFRDHRGGGRSSARETATRVVAGAFARQALEQFGISITAYTSQVGSIIVNDDYASLDFSNIESNPVRCPDQAKAAEMEQLIREVKAEGDTIGGVVTCVVRGVPVGLGDPVFGRLNARLADAMMSINASKGFEYGMGFRGVEKRGSQVIDRYVNDNGVIHALVNNSGGIQGGISNGEDIYFRVAFKPVATLMQDVASIDADGREVVIKAKGRHDPCVVPRAVPIVEAMAAIVILDALLLNRASKI